MYRSRKKCDVSLFSTLLLLMICGSWIGFSEAQRVLLRDVTSLTLSRGVYTAGRRSAPVPQLQCTGGTAYGKYSPKTVQCYNRGFDGVDVQWECKADMPLDFQFGKISVSCEGYDYPNDPFILAGSCGLEYELDYSASGASKGAYQKSPYYQEDKGFDVSKIVFFCIACFVIYLIYTSLTTPREGNEGDRRRGGGFDHGPGRPPGGPHPPGWRPPPSAPPPYEETFQSKSYGSTNTTGPGATDAGGTGGPGFFTGLGLGALGGYFFGNRNTGYDSYGTAYRRRPNYGYTQFERDTGFYDHDSDRPSTSGGYFGGGGSSSSSGSSGTHTSSGYGGTTRR